MRYDRYIDEAVEIVRFAYQTARSVDGFIIKLETAIAHILKHGSEADLKRFFDIITSEGLLNRLACSKDELDRILTSPRHALLNKYSYMLYDALDKAICTQPYEYIIPPPSRSAGQMSWGRGYRDISKISALDTFIEKVRAFIKRYSFEIIILLILLIISLVIISIL